MWPNSLDVESPYDLKLLRTEHDDLSRLLNIGVDVLGNGVINSPARSAGKRDGRDHLHLVNGNNGDGAIHPRRITDIEYEETTPGRIVC